MGNKCSVKFEINAFNPALFINKITLLMGNGQIVSCTFFKRATCYNNLI